VGAGTGTGTGAVGAVAILSRFDVQKKKRDSRNQSKEWHASEPLKSFLKIT
jgi:hypothetical protein